MKTTDKNKLERFKQILKEHGLRLTHQRVVILNELVSAEGHPSAEDVYSRVLKRLPTVSLDTVYRTIASFEKYDIVKRVQVLDDKGRFDSNLDVHHHLVCKRCKKIEDFYWPAFDGLNIPGDLKNWGKVESKYVELRGLCKECRQKSKKR
ncbi:MAG: Fur family transcriptional regulator [Candidatus Zixiibacteriota bacterium]